MVLSKGLKEKEPRCRKYGERDEFEIRKARGKLLCI